MSVAFAERARKVVCIGRNYVDHIKELSNVRPTAPFFFLKPPSSILLPGNGPILIPKGVNVHFEVELAFILGKEVKDFKVAGRDKAEVEKEYLDAIDGYALAIDLTGRNVQDEIKKKGLPWTTAKGFDTFLPLSTFIPKSKIPNPADVTLWLSVNNQSPPNQKDSTKLMIWPIPEILSAISSVMTLQPGDIVLTGTPKGVGSIKPGDHVSGGIEVDGVAIPEAKIELDVADKGGIYEFKN
ncbi:hypothetical protein V1514DRAFT_327059 [Lipomyces japonicus]|uniref:uncharacterized protein n=1 Tax=Lipomyces japonicus TaxID=56871 RepID=UPI0034CD7857